MEIAPAVSLHAPTACDLSFTNTSMSIFGALGFGLTIFILKSMVPEVFQQFVTTTVTVLGGVSSIFSTVSLMAGAAAALHH